MTPPPPFCPRCKARTLPTSKMPAVLWLAHDVGDGPYRATCHCQACNTAFYGGERPPDWRMSNDKLEDAALTEEAHILGLEVSVLVEDAKRSWAKELSR